MKYFIKWMAFVILLTGCGEKNETAPKISDNVRPNILFIMADDHAAQAISAYGHPISQLATTPNIDRIAKEGALFTNTFCTNSICGPSRAVILTGKHSHINGFRMNGEIFNGDQPTYPKMLQKAGYQTAIVGKWHLHGYPQGFDYWKILNDQGNYYNPQFIEPLDTVNFDKEKILKTSHWTVNMPDTTIVEGYVTDLITDYAIDYMKKARQTQKPFLLMVHHKAAHRNWMPALRHLNKYDSVVFPLPETYFSKHENQKAAQQQQMTIYKDMYEGHDLKISVEKGSDELAHNPWKTDFERMTPQQRAIWNKAYRPKNDKMHEANFNERELAIWKGQRYLQDYLATIASVDEGVGKILDYLDQSGLADNTIVVYTSDQGFFLGEKGWFDKRFMYEESLRMPLLIRYPKEIKPGTTVNALVQNLDFAETFLDFAGVEIPPDMQGKSFKNLLTGQSDEDFRDAVYYHYYDYPAFHMVKKMYGVRTKRYKLIHVYDDIDAWELYDLQADPIEEKNLINNESYSAVKARLLVTLDSLQRAYGVTDKEFEKADPKSVRQAYKNLEKLSGKTPVHH